MKWSGIKAYLFLADGFLLVTDVLPDSLDDDMVCAEGDGCSCGCCGAAILDDDLLLKLEELVVLLPTLSLLKNIEIRLPIAIFYLQPTRKYIYI